MPVQRGAFQSRRRVCILRIDKWLVGWMAGGLSDYLGDQSVCTPLNLQGRSAGRRSGRSRLAY